MLAISTALRPPISDLSFQHLSFSVRSLQLLTIPFPRAEPRFTTQRPGKPGTASMAAVPSMALVALEAGNSPQMIFQHYRELVTEKGAKAWFAITPDAALTVKARIEKERTAKIVAFPAKAAA